MTGAWLIDAVVSQSILCMKLLTVARQSYTLYGQRSLSAIIYFIWLHSIEIKDDRKQTAKRWGRKTDLILWIIVAAISVRHEV
jgi:hypothetical protein